MGRFATVLYALFGIPLMLTTWNEMGKFLYKSINEFIVVLGNNWIKFRHSLNILFFKIRQKISGLCCLSIIKKGNRSNSQGSVIKEEDDKSDENNLNEKHNFKFNAIFLDNINNSASRQLEQGKVVSFKLSMQMLQAADNINLRNNERNSKIEPENNSEQNSSETDFSSVQQLNVENLMVKNENEKQEESINYDDSNENSDTSDLTEDDLEQTQPDAPRMHVLDFSGIYEDTTVIVVNGILKQESSFKEQQKDIESKILNLSNSRKQLESSTQTLLPLASER
uniref:Ion_trans_2 domain-containing protein n=1 Tax=Meloidogyne hapla TaxID=6305 RepID=A0A1I8BQ21_MELHA